MSNTRYVFGAAAPKWQLRISSQEPKNLAFVEYWPDIRHYVQISMYTLWQLWGTPYYWLYQHSKKLKILPKSSHYQSQNRRTGPSASRAYTISHRVICPCHMPIGSNCSPAHILTNFSQILGGRWEQLEERQALRQTVVPKLELVPIFWFLQEVSHARGQILNQHGFTLLQF